MNDNNPFAVKNYNTKTNPRVGGLLIDALQIVVFALAISVVVYLFVAIPNQVDGLSMYPNLHNQDILFTNKIIAMWGGPTGILKNYDYQRGDIVVFQEPSNPDLVKRVVGLPGESVKVSQGHVYINGKRLVEEYLGDEVVTSPGTFLAENEEKVVPVNSYFCLGDNRPNSKDSRNADVGFIKREYIKGSPFIRVFPFDRFGLMQRGKSEEI